MSDIFLSRIAIHDFRTFGDFAIDLPAAPGLVLLTGTNGLGKSSFFDAIEWGLTNKIRRFEPYLQTGKKKLAEKDYLTRRGADPGSHRVSLTFSDHDPIERGAGTSTPMAEIIAQLARPDRRTINDLGTYLALTHFLGQASQQRFTSRDPRDQWHALKGPSGIDRLERVRAGLRGRPTVTAFTRRIEQQQASAATLERQMADWQGWMTRLERLRSAARAAGVLTTAEVSERIDQLENEMLQLISGQPLAVAGENMGERLAALGDRISDALRSMSERRTALEALAPLVTQFSIREGESRLEAPNLVRLRGDLSNAQERLDHASPLVNSARDAVLAQQAAMATIEQSIAILDAGRTDLARRAQLSELIAADEADRAALVQAIATRRAALDAADGAIAAHGKAVAELGRLRSLAGSANALERSMVDYLDLESQAGLARAALVQGRKVAEAAAAVLAPLEIQLSDIKLHIAEAEQERAEADRHATAISAALSQLSSHLHEDDTECPVCSTSFEPGVVKALAEAAASGSDGRLAQADEALERLRTKRADLNGKTAGLRSQVAAVEQLERAATAAMRAATDARTAIARALNVSADGDLTGVAAMRRREADAMLATAEAALPQMAANAAAATEQRPSVVNDLDDLIGRESQLGTRLAQFQAEDTACADRIVARNLSSSSIADVEGRLTSERSRSEAARTRLVELTDAVSAAVATAKNEQEAVNAAQRDLAAAELTRTNAEQSTRQMQLRWTQAGLPDIPNQLGYDRGIAALDAKLVGLRSLAERHQILARDNENALLQAEMDEITASMRLTGGDDGFGDPVAYLSTMKAKVDAAKEAVKLTTAARNAVKRYSEELQTQADDFSSRVLDPLNSVIDDFNEAMLSTPGESIQFKADTRVDATTFGMALRYRERVENALESKKDLPPQVVLSEGQLAANGFSILCAASTAYPWSRWRALLLDDPLQHNDIIHTAAFVDVMRNMVELNGYQLIMSSHDRGESDFIARKFDAAGLPCTTVLLTAPSDKGVVWGPPEQNQAATRVLRRSVENSHARTA